MQYRCEGKKCTTPETEKPIQMDIDQICHTHTQNRLTLLNIFYWFSGLSFSIVIYDVRM